MKMGRSSSPPPRAARPGRHRSVIAVTFHAKVVPTLRARAPPAPREPTPASRRRAGTCLEAKDISSAINALMGALAHLLPPTIHPMILHFPIVLLPITALVDLAARLAPDRDRFLQRAGFWLLTLANAATVLTMAAGVISAQAVHFSPAMSALLERHQHFAMLTGLCEGAAWLLRVFSAFPAGTGWSPLGTGRGRGGWVSTLLVCLAAVFVAITGSIGGQLVYDHGAGVLGVTRG